MSVPHLLFPVDVTIEPISKSTTVYDDVTREPLVQVSRGQEITIQAQIQWNRENDGDVDRGGVTRSDSGYLVFRVKDLDAIDYVPARGDKVTSIPGITGAFFIHRFKPAGHRKGQNRLLLAYFEDRQPSRAR